MAAICSGRPGYAPRIGTIRSIDALVSGFDRIYAAAGVSINPGATTFSGIPAPAHCGVIATLRHHRFNACLALEYKSLANFIASAAFIASEGAFLAANSLAVAIAPDS